MLSVSSIIDINFINNLLGDIYEVFFINFFLIISINSFADTIEKKFSYARVKDWAMSGGPGSFYGLGDGLIDYATALHEINVKVENPNCLNGDRVISFEFQTIVTRLNSIQVRSFGLRNIKNNIYDEFTYLNDENALLNRQKVYKHIKDVEKFNELTDLYKAVYGSTWRGANIITDQCENQNYEFDVVLNETAAPKSPFYLFKLSLEKEMSLKVFIPKNMVTEGKYLLPINEKEVKESDIAIRPLVEQPLPVNGIIEECEDCPKLNILNFYFESLEEKKREDLISFESLGIFILE